MKIIEILQKVANGEIKEGTKFILNDNLFIFNGIAFESNEMFYLENCIFLKEEDLNREVDLILPKPKKYLVKFNVRGWREFFNYLNYYEKTDSIEINNNIFTGFAKTHFTKKELKSIQPVRDFLEDMEGKYELIEVEE